MDNFVTPFDGGKHLVPFPFNVRSVSSPHQVTWQWLKGHIGHPDNERCDQLAGAKIVKVRRNYSPEKLAALRETFVASRDPNRNQASLL
jgi:hypothetical protein